MTNNEYSPETGSQMAAEDTWSRARERLDHLRIRKVSDSSLYIWREYQTALAEFERACLSKNNAWEGRAEHIMTTNRNSLGSGIQSNVAATWSQAKERLDHLRVRKVSNSSPFVKREYQKALAEFDCACLARRFS